MASVVDLRNPATKYAIYFGAISTLIPVAAAKDFDKWYPWFGARDKVIWGPCVAAYNNMTKGTQDYCLDVTNCIMGGLAETDKAAMSGIGVFLGFTPTVMALVGPSTIELACLSITRPILSTLLGCGTPGFFFGRPFPLSGADMNLDEMLQKEAEESEADRDMLKTGNAMYSAIASSKSGFLGPAISFLEYFLAAGAVVNTIHNTYQIASLSLISFSCPHSGVLPYIWNLFSLLIQAYILVLGWSIRAHFNIKSDAAASNGLYSWSPFGFFKAWLKDETKLCCKTNIKRSAWSSDKQVRESASGHFRGVILRWLGDALQLAQFALGTIVMSSIIFVRSEDAALIVVRYVVSCLVVRCIVAFEVDGMRYSWFRGKKTDTSDAQSMYSLN